MNKKNYIGIIIIIAFISSLVGLKIWQYHWPEAEVMLKEQTLHVLVARTPYQWYRGLGKRDNLDNFDGMLFVFSLPKRAGIVMREMRFPIDIIWIDKGKVVDIANNVPIEPIVEEDDFKVYYPRIEANMVLELKAGWVNDHNLQIGDYLSPVQ